MTPAHPALSAVAASGEDTAATDGDSRPNQRFKDDLDTLIEELLFTHRPSWCGPTTGHHGRG